MLDIKFIRENQELIKKGALDKNFEVPIQELIELDEAIRPLKQNLESLQNERNMSSKKISQAKPEERDALKKAVKSLKSKMESYQNEISTLRSRFNKLMLLVPQPANNDVPIGKSDQENVEIKKWGKPREFDFTFKDHVKLGEENNLIDIPRGVKLSGSRSYVLTGQGALLEQALLRFTYDHLLSKNFTPMSVPVLVREETMEGTGYFPVGRDQAYCVEKDELALVGTSEVPLCSFFSNETLDEKDLPIKLMAQSSCFRREAGTYGKDTKGLYRVHQFQKIEMVIISPASQNEDDKLHSELLKTAEEILQMLELPYRVVYVCTGDLGQGQVRKHDIETWMPSRNAYGETHSCSSFKSFQSRRLNIKYKTKEGKKDFVYTLNNTAIAIPRVMLAIIENFQNKDGSITLPKKLRPYMGDKEFI